MSVLDTVTIAPFRRTDDTSDAQETDSEVDREIDLRGDLLAPAGHRDRERERVDDPLLHPPAPDLSEGVRVRRVRVGSVAKVATVFFLVGYLAVLGTLVTCWNIVQQLGFVSDVEDLAITSLGLDSFTIDGQQLFELSAIVIGAAFALALVFTVLLALVYNATCALLGGVAVEFGPLRRRRRVFSPKHRRFISV